MLVFTVVLPVVTGHLLRRLSGGLSDRTTDRAGIMANLAILGIIAIAVGLRRSELSQVAWSLLGILAIINVGGYLAGYAGGLGFGLPEPMRRALTLEVGMQNAGAGTALAISLFGEDSTALIPCILYTFGCMLTGTTLATLWRHFAPSKDAADLPETVAGEVT